MLPARQLKRYRCTWVATFAVVLCLSGCGDTPSCDSDKAMFPIVTGEYYSTYGKDAPVTVARFDLEKGIVEIRYIREGKEVIETWIVTASEVR